MSGHVFASSGLTEVRVRVWVRGRGRGRVRGRVPLFGLIPLQDVPKGLPLPLSLSPYSTPTPNQDEPTGRQPFGRTYGRADLCYPRASQPACQITSALELFYQADGTYNFEYSDAEIAEIVAPPPSPNP